MSASNTKDLTLAKYLHANDQLKLTSLKNDLLEMPIVKKLIKEINLKITIILGILQDIESRYSMLSDLLKENEELYQGTINNIQIMLKASATLTEKLTTAFNKYYSKRNDTVSLWSLGSVLSTFKGFEKENETWKKAFRDSVQSCNDHNKELSRKWNKVPRGVTKAKDTPHHKMYKKELDNFVFDAIRICGSLNNFQEDLDRKVNTENFEAWKKAIKEKRFKMEFILAIFEKKRDLVYTLLQKNRTLERSNRSKDRKDCITISTSLESEWAGVMYTEFGEVYKRLFLVDSALLGPLWRYFPTHNEFDGHFHRETLKISKRVQECKANIDEMMNEFKK